MKHGFTRLALLTPRIKVGAASYNADQAIKLIKTAAINGAEVIGFPLNVLTGATMGSMKNYTTLLNGALLALNKVADYTANINSIVLITLPLNFKGEVLSACVAIFKGEPLSVFLEKKTDFLSKEVCFSLETIEILGKNVPVDGIIEIPHSGARIGVSVGADMNGLSPVSEALCRAGANLIINSTLERALVGSSVRTVNKATVISERLKCVYALCSGGDGESVHSFVSSGEKIIAEDGNLIKRSELDHDEYIIADVDTDALNLARLMEGISYSGKFIEAPLIERDINKLLREVDPLPFVSPFDEYDRVWEILGQGIHSRMREVGTKKVILGLSGGLDSTMVLIMAVKLFNKYKFDLSNIICVTMKGLGSSSRTQNNAQKLINLLKVTNINIPIDEAVKKHLEDIGHKEKDATYENAQARERAQILLDLSNKHGALLLGTGDLSEIALGWSTFGGDQLAHYNPNRSVSKTLIRAMLRNFMLTTGNNDTAGVLNDILATPISPELLENQETEVTLGAYELHDFILFNLVGKGFSVAKTYFLLKTAYPSVSEAELKRVIKLFITRFFTNQFKRSASCDGIQLTRYDLTEKIIFSDFSSEEWLKELELLK